MVSKRNWDVGMLVVLRVKFEYGGACFIAKVTKKNEAAEVLYCSRIPNKKQGFSKMFRVGEVVDLRKGPKDRNYERRNYEQSLANIAVLKGNARDKAGRTSFAKRV